ncbi:hypothetical protein DP73_15710 [Desulfosporosinus sp. HMP52]|nr:hypothetical protein DP73_15710 [Desulfosporosinus sp. HMP52]
MKEGERQYKKTTPADKNNSIPIRGKELFLSLVELKLNYTKLGNFIETPCLSLIQIPQIIL